MNHLRGDGSVIGLVLSYRTFSRRLNAAGLHMKNGMAGSCLT